MSDQENDNEIEEMRRQLLEQQVHQQMGLHLSQTAMVKLNWWIVAANFERISAQTALNPELSPLSFSVNKQKPSYAYHLTIDTRQEGFIFVGSLVLKPRKDSTEVEAVSESARFLPYWRTVLEQLTAFAERAEALRRVQIPRTIDAILEEYARAKAAGESITLKQLAEDVGISYSYVRKRKSQKETAKHASNQEE